MKRRWQGAPFPPRTRTKDPITVPANTSMRRQPSSADLKFTTTTSESPGLSNQNANSNRSQEDPLIAVPLHTFLMWQQQLQLAGVDISSLPPISPGAPENGTIKQNEYNNNVTCIIKSPKNTSLQPVRPNCGPMQPSPICSNSNPLLGNQKYMNPCPSHSQPATEPQYYPPNRPIWLTQGLSMINNRDTEIAQLNSSRSYTEQRQMTKLYQFKSGSVMHRSPSSRSSLTTNGIYSHPHPEVLEPLMNHLRKRRNPVPPLTLRKASMSTSERYMWLNKYEDQLEIHQATDFEPDSSSVQQLATTRSTSNSTLHLPNGKHVQKFKPYTLTDYELIKKVDGVTKLPTSVGPSNDDETRRRRNKVTIAHDYAEKVRRLQRQRSTTM